MYTTSFTQYTLTKLDEMQFLAYVEAEFFEFFDTNAKTKAQPE